MYHLEQKCAHFCSEWCIVGYRAVQTDALWDLWVRSIASYGASCAKHCLLQHWGHKCISVLCEQSFWNYENIAAIHWTMNCSNILIIPKWLFCNIARSLSFLVLLMSTCKFELRNALSSWNVIARLRPLPGRSNQRAGPVTLVETLHVSHYT